jgi:prenyltransferase beta subunit
MPKEIPQWWRQNLSQFLRLGYIEGKDWAAFGSVSGDMFSQDLYTTYACVGILNSLSCKIEDPDSVIEWIKSLQNPDGSYSEKNVQVAPISQTYWAISILKMLSTSPSNPQLITKFLKNYEQSDGFFVYDKSFGNNLESRISQTYFPIKILSLMNIDANEAGKIFNFKDLSKALQSYIASHISSCVSLGDEKADYLISAIYELSYINKSLLSKETFKWMNDRIQEIDTLPYGVPYPVAIILDLLDTISSVGIKLTPEDLNKIQTYLKDKVFPNMNPSGGFGFNEESSIFIEPMVTYAITELFKLSGMKQYPNADKLIENINIHRVKSGWIKFYILKPDLQATYYAVSLAKLNGDIKNYSVDKIVNYLLKTVNFISNISEDMASSSTFDVSESTKYLETLYLVLKTYNVLGKHAPTNQIIKTADAIMNAFTSSMIIKNGEGAEEIKMYSYYMQIFNLVGYWPTDEKHERWLEMIETISSGIISSEISSQIKIDIRLLYHAFIVTSAFTLNNYFGNYFSNKHSNNIISITKALKLLVTKNGFKRSPEINTTDMESTYLGVWLANQTGNLELVKSHSDKIFKFVIDSQEEYGFNYAPDEKSVYSDYRSTYCALWILSFLENLKSNGK